jgi:hypothetical protein
MGFWLKGEGGGPGSPRIFLKIFYTHRTLQNQKSKKLKTKMKNRKKRKENHKNTWTLALNLRFHVGFAGSK